MTLLVTVATLPQQQSKLMTPDEEKTESGGDYGVARMILTETRVPASFPTHPRANIGFEEMSSFSCYKKRCRYVVVVAAAAAAVVAGVLRSNDSVLFFGLPGGIRATFRCPAPSGAALAGVSGTEEKAHFIWPLLINV